MALLSHLKKRLSRTRENLVGGLARIVLGSPAINEELWDGIEEILIRSDVGMETTLKLMAELKAEVRNLHQPHPHDILNLLQKKILKILQNGSVESTPTSPSYRPHIILVVGVNGTGKTTSIAKLAKMYGDADKKVLLAGCDTFRAAAAEQLNIWAQRLGVDLVKNQPGSDPAAIAYDALQAAQAREIDVLIIDTAGRLHTKRNLMEELRKIKRVIAKQIQNGPHETLLVLDATVGQNAISQAQLFHRDVGITGIFLAKLDGTAKGGIVIAIKDRLHIPVAYIGIGESLEDIERFDARTFVGALFSKETMTNGSSV